MSITYTQSVRKFQESVHTSLVMLQSDPHFQTLVQLWRDGRENLVRQLCMEGLSQKDQDRLRGAIYFADQILDNATPKKTNGYGSRDAGFDIDE